MALSQTVTLLVNNGSGSGIYNKGDTIHIWSDPTPPNHSFSSWSGSAVNFLLESNEWHTRLVVPTSSNVTFISAIANIDTLHNLTISIGEDIELPAKVNGSLTSAMKEVNYTAPTSPKGMIFCFHGTGGSGSAWFSKYENISFVKSAILRGYIVVSTDANEKTVGDQNNDNALRWEINDALTDDINNNIDIRVISALTDTIIYRLGLSSGIPIFGLGMSNGSNFSDLCAAALDFSASGHVTANGHPDVYALRSDATPVIFVQSENDQHANAQPQVAIDNYNALVQRGISAEFHWHRKSPVYKKRFLRSSDEIITPEVSDSIFTRMINTPGLIDSNNIMTIILLSSLPSDLLLNLGLSNGETNNCESQLKILNADHKFHGDFNNRILDFFDVQLMTNHVESSNTTSFLIQIFPNPTNDLITLDINGYNGAIQTQVYDLSGRLLETTNSTTISLKDYAKGIYVFRVSYGDIVEELKVVKD